MLALDDPRWKELQDAYGDAGDIPDRLRALAVSTRRNADLQREQWFDLWSRLCHQGHVYTASYAAVPHIVHIAKETEGPIDFSFFAFPAAVEIARRTGRGPEIPAVAVDAYHQAIVQLIDNVTLHRRQAWDQPMLLAVAAALAAAKGHIAAAEAMLNLDDNWIGRIKSDEVD